MLNDTIRRRKLARDAARYLDDREVEWVTGYWLIELDGDGQVDERGDHLAGTEGTPIGKVREWLRDHGFGARNRQCGVCAEGALLLAFANDPLIDDDVIAYNLLEEFKEDAAVAASKLGYLDDYEEFESIPELNDSQFGSASQAADLLREMGNL